MKYTKLVARVMAEYRALQIGNKEAASLLGIERTTGIMTGADYAIRRGLMTRKEKGYLNTGMYEDSSTAPRWR